MIDFRWPNGRVSQVAFIFPPSPEEAVYLASALYLHEKCTDMPLAGQPSAFMAVRAALVGLVDKGNGNVTIYGEQP